MQFKLLYLHGGFILQKDKSFSNSRKKYLYKMSRAHYGKILSLTQ